MNAPRILKSRFGYIVVLGPNPPYPREGEPSSPVLGVFRTLREARAAISRLI